MAGPIGRAVPTGYKFDLAPEYVDSLGPEHQARAWAIHKAINDWMQSNPDMSQGYARDPSFARQMVQLSQLRRQAANSVKQAFAGKDILHGGPADKTPERAFDPKDLRDAAEHETEHTTNYQLAKEIASDHLKEDPQYYKKLKKLKLG